MVADPQLPSGGRVRDVPHVRGNSDAQDKPVEDKQTSERGVQSQVVQTATTDGCGKGEGRRTGDSIYGVHGGISHKLQPEPDIHYELGRDTYIGAGETQTTF